MIVKMLNAVTIWDIIIGVYIIILNKDLSVHVWNYRGIQCLRRLSI